MQKTTAELKVMQNSGSWQCTCILVVFWYRL